MVALLENLTRFRSGFSRCEGIKKTIYHLVDALWPLISFNIFGALPPPVSRNAVKQRVTVLVPFVV